MIKHVTSFEISLKLKDLGAEQKSLFYWVCAGVSDSGWSLMYHEEVFTLKNEIFERIAAFTASEIYLPPGIVSGASYHKNKFWCGPSYTYDTEALNTIPQFVAANEADARAEMRIFLNKHPQYDKSPW